MTGNASPEVWTTQYVEEVHSHSTVFLFLLAYDPRAEGSDEKSATYGDTGLWFCLELECWTCFALVTVVVQYLSGCMIMFEIAHLVLPLVNSFSRLIVYCNYSERLSRRSLLTSQFRPKIVEEKLNLKTIKRKWFLMRLSQEWRDPRCPRRLGESWVWETLKTELECEEKVSKDVGWEQYLH